MKKQPIRTFSSSIEKIFTIYVCLIPILEYYNSPIVAINCSTFLAIIFGIAFLFGLVFNKRKMNAPIVFAGSIYLVFIAMNIVVCSSLNDYDLNTQILLPFLRLGLLLTSIVFLGHKYFKIEFAIKFLRLFICFCSATILIQYLSKYFLGYVIHPVLSFALRDKGYLAVGDRFSAFYMEPAHFAFSAIMFLIFEFFYCEKKHMIAIALTTIGILISGSGQGYLFLGIIYFLWSLKMIYLSRKSAKYLFYFLSSALVVLLIFLIASQIPFVQYSISRIISDNGQIGGQALAGRTSTGRFFEYLSPSQKWFGIGFGRIGTVTSLFVSSFYTHLIECGYISLFVISIVLFPSIVEKKYHKFALIIFFVLMFYFSSIANPMTLSLFLLFLYSDSTIKKKNYRMGLVL